ncbi:thioredoxin family protein [Clostridium sp. E02]|uniref:thioredoxin family protein n=1 Tax=Clostridium sp. E02 TaxID=2487134 RepID=UPI000F530576|nr:thioredoxin family protein [Clostridium sp. E02]
MKKAIRLSIIVILLVLSASSFYINSTSSDHYELIPIQSIQELSDIVQSSNSAYIYFGRPTCPDCSDFIPILEKELQLAKTNVYYFNTDRFNKEPEYENVIKTFQIIWIPALYETESGNITNSFDLKFEQNSDEESRIECESYLKNFFLKQEGIALCIIK